MTRNDQRIEGTATTPSAAPHARSVPPTAAQTEAEKAILEKLEAGENLILLIGDSGTGKSFLLHKLADDWHPSHAALCLVDRGGRIGPEHLKSCDLLLVDEGQDMNDRGRSLVAMRERLLSLQTVIAVVGTEDLHLPRPVAGIPAVRLRRLDDQEAAAFARNIVADRARQLVLSDDALAVIVAAGGGLVSTLRILVRNSCLEAAFDNQSEITAEHANRAAAMLPGQETPAVPGMSADIERSEYEEAEHTGSGQPQGPPLIAEPAEKTETADGESEWSWDDEEEPARRKWPVALLAATLVGGGVAGAWYYLNETNAPFSAEDASSKTAVASDRFVQAGPPPETTPEESAETEVFLEDPPVETEGNGIETDLASEPSADTPRDEAPLPDDAFVLRPLDPTAARPRNFQRAPRTISRNPPRQAAPPPARLRQSPPTSAPPEVILPVLPPPPPSSEAEDSAATEATRAARDRLRPVRNR